MNWVKMYLFLVMFLFTGCLIVTFTRQNPNHGLARAEESVVHKIQDQAGDVKVNSKKLARKGKKKIRKFTGNQSLSKDIGDASRNTADEISNSVAKMKRKANQKTSK